MGAGLGKLDRLIGRLGDGLLIKWRCTWCSSVVHVLSDPAAGIPGEEPHCSVCQEEWDQSDSSNHGNRILICGKCGIGKLVDTNTFLVHKAKVSQIFYDSDVIYFESSTNIISILSFHF